VSQPEDSAAARREVLKFALALAAITWFVLFLSDGFVLFSRPLWVDEVIAALIASRPSPVAVIGDLGAGADGGASLFHLSLWALRRLTGSLAPALLRSLMLASVLGTLVLVYAVLRREFTRGAASAGALAIGANGLVIEHSYDARFYGPWLLACATLAWLLSRRNRYPLRRNGIALGVVAFAMCTIHFYGIITLGLMTTGAIVAGGGEWRERARRMAPAAWGLLALLVVVPLAFAQRNAYSVPSWLPDFQWPQLTELLRQLWLARIPLAAAFIMVCFTAVNALRPAMGIKLASLRRALEDPGIAALAALGILPLALTTLSLAGQPSMLARYAIPAVLVWGPWVAIAGTFLGRWLLAAAHVVIVAFWFIGYTRVTADKNAFAQSVAAHRSALQTVRAEHPAVPVAFASMHVMYATVWPDHLDDARAAFLEVDDATFGRWFPDSTAVGQANRGVILERDLTRAHARRMGFPRLLRREVLDTTPVFFVQGAVSRLPIGFASAEHYMKSMFPAHSVRRLHADLLLLERSIGSPTRD